MAYQSLVYGFVFLPLCLAAYQIAPQTWRKRVLLAFSYLFFWLLSRELIIYLLGTTVFVHCIGIWLEWLKSEQKAELLTADRSEKKRIKSIYQKRSRHVLAFGVLMLLGTLAYLKYYNFFASNVNGIFGGILPFTIEQKNILMPVGISFYTLQAIGYMADVYWGKIRAEENMEKTALFMAFFPQIMEGPICRYQDTCDTLYEGRPLQMNNLTDGYIRIFWGLFKKTVIADRLAIGVDAIFGNYASYNGSMIVFAAVAYTIQLYMEFSGCMDIIIGSGQLFGVKLPENFRQPFSAQSAAEFWRRWHITLGTWFKNIYFLSRVHVISGKEVESVRQKTFWKIYYDARDICYSAVSGMDVQRIVARGKMELYILRDVLFFTHPCRNISGTCTGPYSENITYQSGVSRA